MRLDIKFRLSVYLSLVLASACLGHAEEAFLPGVLVFVTSVSLLFALAFVLEGRWSLTVLAANVLGVFIASGAALWILSRLLRPPEGFGVAMPWQAMLLPYIGPVLICLLLAKLFRPKQVNDFWLLHTVGLMEVILACVLASEPLSGLLLLAYVVCTLGSLSLFYAYRERLRAGGDVRLPTPPSLPRLRSLAGMIQGLGWSLLLLLLALPLFLLTPKLGESAWSPFSIYRTGPAVVAYSDGMDLNRVGRLRPTDKIAFEVEARDAGDGPKTDIDLEQRWRGAVLDQYERGRWFNRDQTSMGLPRRTMTARWRTPRTVLPRPQRGEYTLTFAVPGETSALFLADPVYLLESDLARRVRLVPVASGHAEGRKSWNYEPNDFALHLVVQQPVHRYIQLMAPPAEAGLSARVHESVASDAQYVQAPPAGVHRIAAELVLRFLDDGTLSGRDAAVTGEAISVPANRWETVAGAFARYFATSGDFGYSLDLTRKDMTLDPNEDFLRNLRFGHCERFASALTLLLRGCGIPTRIVIGFRGTEPAGDGNYVVRQNAAHSWVEVLVPRPQPDGTTHWHWRTFDPTPDDDDITGGEGAGGPRWLGWQALGSVLWHNFLVDYNAEKRVEAGGEIARWFSPGRIAAGLTASAIHARAEWLALGLLLALALAIAVRRRRRHPPPDTPAPGTFGFPAYADLLHTLKARLQLEPRRSQTPLEFAGEAAEALRARADTAELAGIPLRVVEALYRVRYGKLVPDQPVAAEFERQVRQIDEVLRAGQG